MISKLLILLTSMTLASATYAFEFTPQQENAVLLMLNNFCGDAWCEGAYDIQFKSIQLNQSAGAFVLAAATTADHSDETTTVSIPFQCHIDDSLIENVLQTEYDDAAYEHQSKLFIAISDCIDAALYRRK